MLLNIGSMRKSALELSNKDKKYSGLLRQIVKDDFFYGEGKVPSLKEVADRSGVSNSKARKLIEDIYNDLVLEHESRAVFSFPKVRYEFLIRGSERSKFIGIDVEQLPVMPRVGEEVSLPFFSAYIGTTSFYVEEIMHEFEEDCQVVNIWMRAGSYNSYWHYRKDKAKEENELPFFDWLNLEEQELKKKLNVGRWK
jgi:hypothetical protein